MIYVMINTLLLSVIEDVKSGTQGGIFDFNATLPLMMVQFIILMIVLNYLFYKPVTNVLDERTNYIRNSLTTASAYLLQADELTQKYEEALAESRKQAQNIIRQSQKEAQDIVAVNIKQAQQEAEKLVDEASEQLNVQKEQALKTLEDQVDILSDHIKSKLLSCQFF
uniref:ATP synthase subunit b', chloroplastic n=2 Tax=Corallina TaxID=35169 RepID=A0A6M3WAH9_COROI|nr:ATP synthase CFO B' subunit subunit II [Corallina officinalis]QJF58532.1 ATP synthase CFO B' subunit subunit II [Corallina officinalis]QJF58731.1 ATP synthase CFO B' subunit subunit II [Corallina officinalis]QJF58930.1 ATP synthase CFO B' subunit subunit II [Corallina officinalis]